MATAEATSPTTPGRIETTTGAASKAGAESKWANPQVPIGNGPDLPKWPLVASWTAWVLWIGFLVAMLLAG